MTEQEDCIHYCTSSNWTIRPNPEGQIIRKPEGGIFNHKAEMTKNGKAEFDRKAE